MRSAEKSMRQSMIMVKKLGEASHSGIGTLPEDISSVWGLEKMSLKFSSL